MPEWEYRQIHLSAAALRQPGEPVQHLAQRLSEAIIDSVNVHKTNQWELLKMDFDSGEVTIHFRRLHVQN